MIVAPTAELALAVAACESLAIIVLYLATYGKVGTSIDSIHRTKYGRIYVICIHRTGKITLIR